MIVVAFSVFLDLVGFGILIPVQPFLALSFGATPVLVTLLGASFSLMQFLFVPFWGSVSDKIGRKPVMLISIAASALGFIIFGLAQNLLMLFAARMISGLGGANIGTAQAIMADSTSDGERAKGMAYIGLAFGLGFIFGPALGGIFSQFGLATPAFIAATLAIVNLVFASLVLPETRWNKSNQASHQSYFGGTLAALRKAQVLQNAPQLLMLSLFVVLSFSMLEHSLGLFIQAVWVPQASAFVGAGPAAAKTAMRNAVELTTYFLVVIGVSATILQGFFLGKLVDRFGERKLIILGSATLAITLFLVPLMGSLKIFWLMLILAVGIAIGTGVTFPSISSLLSKSAGDQEQGTILGLAQSLSALGKIIGPSLAGLFFQWQKGAPFWIASLGMLFCVMIGARIFQHRALAPP